MNAGSAAYREGRLAEAEHFAQEALRTAEGFGPDDPRRGHSLSNLGLVYAAQGRYPAAERLYTRALAIFERALGPDHPAVAQSLTNLAALYRVTDRITAADELDRRAAGIRAHK
jgi:tetratricopeptide (TPR) repeat protein